MGDNIREEEQAKVDGLRAVNRMLREQNRVLREAAQQAMDLIHEDIVQGDKAGRRLKAEAILWNALTATSQPISKKGDYSHHPAFDEYGEHR